VIFLPPSMVERNLLGSNSVSFLAVITSVMVVPLKSSQRSKGNFLFKDDDTNEETS
jgi:hypothetical protein